MAVASAVSKMMTDTPVAIAMETFYVQMNADTSIVITPTKILAIDNVTIIPQDAIGGNWTATYPTGFLPGDPTIQFIAQVNSLWYVTLYGRI